jgi:signal transduction histidine kinase
MITGLLRRLLCLLICLGALACTMVGAQGLDLGGPDRQVDVWGELAILEDPTAKLSPATALAQPGWQVATPRLMSRGTSTSAFWLRLVVVNHASERITRWLGVGSQQLEDIGFYRLAPGGDRVQQFVPGGAVHPRKEMPLAGRTFVFPVSLASGEGATLLLRVQGRTTLSMDVGLWEPAALREQEASKDFSHLIPLTALITIALYLLVHALARLDRPLLLLAAWLLLAALHDLAYGGYLNRYVLTGGGEPSLRASAVLANLAVAMCAAFMYVFLELSRLKFWRNVYLGLPLVFLAVALGAAFGNLRLFIALTNSFLMAFLLIWPLSMLLAWRQRLPNVGIFFIAIAGQWVILMLRLLTGLGMAPTMVDHDSLAITILLGFTLVLLYFVVRRSMAEHKMKTDTQAAMLQRNLEQQVQLEEAVRSRTQALQEAVIAADDANRAKSDFLARLSHDLRSPLTAIIGYAEMIIAAGRPDAQNGRIIRRSAQHLLALLNDLIDYARGSAQPNALLVLPIYTSTWLDSITADARALATKHGNSFDFKVFGNLPLVIEVDAKRLRQVLENLLTNASKFTTHGNIDFHVTVSTDDTANDSSPQHFLFTVRDNGPGIAAEELAQIFEPFHRLKGAEHHEGLGLGLAIAQQWIKRMGGSIEASSVLGLGTTMQVRIALQQSSEDSLSHQNQILDEGLPPTIDGRDCRIWIVEDSHIIRGMLCAELGGLGFTVVPISNGQEALERVNQPETKVPDLILTDLQMPFADGKAVLKAARAKWPEVPVVLLTATHDWANHGRDGFSAVLPKPVSLTLLRQSIARLLGLQTSGQSTDVDTFPLALVYPDQQYLDEALLLIRMGAISDLVDWASALAEKHEQWRSFADWAKELADRGNLKDLAILCDSAQRNPAAVQQALFHPSGVTTINSDTGTGL